MGSDDTAVIVMKFPCGALCVIDNSRQTSYGYDIRAEVLGSNGMATLGNPLENNVLLSTANGHSTSSVCIFYLFVVCYLIILIFSCFNYLQAPYSFPERFADAYKHELNHWVDIIEKTKTPMITSQDCIGACQITALAQKSREQQRSFDESSTTRNIELKKAEETPCLSFSFFSKMFKQFECHSHSHYIFIKQILLNFHQSKTKFIIKKKLL